MDICYDDIKELMRDFGFYLQQNTKVELSDEVLEEALEDFLDGESDRLDMFNIDQGSDHE